MNADRPQYQSRTSQSIAESKGKSVRERSDSKLTNVQKSLDMRVGHTFAESAKAGI
jgi:hypothetical protein